MLRQVADQTDPTAFLSVGSCTSEGQKLFLGRSAITVPHVALDAAQFSRTLAGAGMVLPDP